MLARTLDFKRIHSYNDGMIAGTFRRAWESIKPRPGQPFWRLMLVFFLMFLPLALALSAIAGWPWLGGCQAPFTALSRRLL